MALQNSPQSPLDSWVNFFQYAGIPSAEAKQYAQIFVDKRMIDPGDLTKEILKDLGIKVIGDIVAILKHAKMISKDTKPETEPVAGATGPESSQTAKFRAT